MGTAQCAPCSASSAALTSHKMLRLVVFTSCLLASLALLAPLASGQEDGRVLAQPVPRMCESRPKHFSFNHRLKNGDSVTHNYFYSNNTKEFDDVKVDWLDARNHCRKKCMDLVSLETKEENRMISNFVRTNNLDYIWTSGRLCDFDGCDRDDLKPKNINGWFWSGSGSRISRTDRKPRGWPQQPWSTKGHKSDHPKHTGGPQPDNAEFYLNESSESCLGLLNNIYKDGIKWHDIACYHTKPFICEDSDKLLQYVRDTNEGIKL